MLYVLWRRPSPSRRRFTDFSRGVGARRQSHDRRVREAGKNPLPDQFADALQHHTGVAVFHFALPAVLDQKLKVIADFLLARNILCRGAYRGFPGRGSSYTSVRAEWPCPSLRLRVRQLVLKRENHLVHLIGLKAKF